MTKCVDIGRGSQDGKCNWRPNVSQGHFLESDHMEGRKRAILKPNAVPSIFSYGTKKKSKNESENQEVEIGMKL